MVSASFPGREFSQAIIGPHWPEIDPDEVWSASEAQAQHARQAENASDDYRRTASSVRADNSGQFINGYSGALDGRAKRADDTSSVHQQHSQAAQQAGNLLHDTRSKLDTIDHNAHEQIHEARSRGKEGQAAIPAIVVAAAGAAAGVAADAVGLSAELPGMVAASAPSWATMPASVGTPLGSGVGLPAPQSGGPKPQSGGQPQQVPSAADQVGASQPSTGDDTQGDKDDGKPSDKKPKDGDRPSALAQLGDSQPLAAAPPSAPPTPSPASSAMPSTSGLSGLGSSMPSTSGLGAPPVPPTPPGGPGTSLPPPSAMPPPPSALPPPAAAFGQSAGMGGAAPVTPAAPAMPAPASVPSVSSTASSGPPSAPRRDETPTPAPTPPTPAPTGVASSGPPVGAPMGGPLPPFTPDTARPAAAAAPQAAPVSAAAPSATPPPLPPGVLASGVGTAASASGASTARTGPRSPRLEAAARLVHELMHASRAYGPIDWCVATFDTPAGPQTAFVSNEGAGFIPAGVFVPRAALPVFADRDLRADFKAQWFGHLNPAETMCAYARLVSDRTGAVQLVALAVSTDYGGTARPATDAGLRHVEECTLARCPIGPDDPPATLDATRVHRLETISPVEYAQLVGGVQRANWPRSRDAVAAVLARASELITLSVPPIIRHVATALDTGDHVVTDEQWDELEEATRVAQLFSAANRGSRYARAHHDLARAAELLTMWRTETPLHPEIAYLTNQIAYAGNQHERNQR